MLTNFQRHPSRRWQLECWCTEQRRGWQGVNACGAARTDDKQVTKQQTVCWPAQRGPGSLQRQRQEDQDEMVKSPEKTWAFKDSKWCTEHRKLPQVLQHIKKIMTRFGGFFSLPRLLFISIPLPNVSIFP